MPTIHLTSYGEPCACDRSAFTHHTWCCLCQDTLDESDCTCEPLQHNHREWIHADDFDGPEDYASACATCPVCNS